MARAKKAEAPKPKATGEHRELPARAMVTLELEDPVFGAGVDEYSKWAVSNPQIAGAIVRVSVTVGEGSAFDPEMARAALLAAGAHHVVPIVPSRRAAAVSKVEAWPDRLPVPEAFARWMEGRALLKGVERGDVDSAFREVLEMKDR